MLLKMRGVLPKTTTDAEAGYLVSADRENEAAVEWFEKVKLNGERLPTTPYPKFKKMTLLTRLLFIGLHLGERADAPFDATNPACWDLKYCSKLLLL